MPLHFNPSDVQATGVGLAAFLASLSAVFVFLSARREKLGRAMIPVFVASSVWAWFGFFYHVAGDLGLARDFRVVSVIGIIWLCITHVNFSTVYYRERSVMGWWTQIARMFIFVVGGLLTMLLTADLFGSNFIVGTLDEPTSAVLAPHAGPLMAVVIGFYLIAVAISGVLLAQRARHASDATDRRQVEWVFWSFVIGLILGGTRFTPWYGFDYYPLVGDIGYPLFIFAMFYAMKRYHLLNLQIAAAQLLIFVLWASTFFRMLLNTSLRAALPDIGLFLAVLVLGVLLLRSIIKERRQQLEIAAMTVERAKSEFITVAAHQLRTPLSAVRWSLDLLLTDTAPLTAEQREIAQKGSRAAENMMAIVHDLLDAARMNEGRFPLSIEPGDLREAGKVALSILEDEAKRKGVTLSLEAPDTPVTADFDRGKLALVIENLLDNSIKYTKAGGSVRVRVANEENGASLSIADTGIGIARDEQARLFEKFFRGKEAVHLMPDGSGLGLFIARTIVEEHGGKLTFTSQEGQGTTFTVSLPRRARTT